MIEGKQKNLTKKLQLLKLTLNKTSALVEKGNLQAISRHREALVHIVGEADGLKRVVEALRHKCLRIIYIYIYISKTKVGQTASR